MTSVTSNEDFFAVLKELIDAWYDRRAFKCLATILRPFIGFNGMTDGWGELLNRLKGVRAFCRDQISEAEMDKLGELIRAAEVAIHRH